MSANLSSNLDTLFGKMEGFISTKTVVGTPIYLEGVIIVPLVDVVFGVGAGVSDSKDEKGSDGGGGGLGGKISPTAVLVIVDGTVQMVSV
ncbi:MAG: sporulation protein, partial [Clostridiales bacterium]|nr:sporulation protein [Clostridiales bacterium]